MSDNTRSLPHSSSNGDHLDVYTYVEGKTEPVKFHELIDSRPAEIKSIDSLRQRLGSQKSY